MIHAIRFWLLVLVLSPFACCTLGGTDVYAPRDASVAEDAPMVLRFGCSCAWRCIDPPDEHTTFPPPMCGTRVESWKYEADLRADIVRETRAECGGMTAAACRCTAVGVCDG